MKAITAQDLLRSQTFFLTTTMDALKIVAEANGRPFSDAVEAYKYRAPSVCDPVEKLVMKVAQEMADALNASLVSASPVNAGSIQ